MLPRVGALVEGPAAYGHLSGRDQPRRCSTRAGPGGRARTAQGPRSRRRSSRSGSAGVGRPAGQGVLARHAAAARPGRRAAARPRAADPRRADERPRPAGHPRDPRAAAASCNADGTTVFLSSHLLAEVEQLCTRVGVLDRGRLVLQDELATCARRPAGSSSTRPSSRPAAACSAARVDGTRRTPRYRRRTRSRPSSTPQLVQRRHPRQTPWSPSGARLEEVVLDATGPSTDRIDRAPR